MKQVYIVHKNIKVAIDPDLLVPVLDQTVNADIDVDVVVIENVLNALIVYGAVSSNVYL
jgi:hypothetical protein